MIFSILYVSMAIVGVTFCCVGAVSYLAWPEVTHGSITAELSEEHPGSVLWTICALLASASVRMCACARVCLCLNVVACCIVIGSVLLAPVTSRTSVPLLLPPPCPHALDNTATIN